MLSGRFPGLASYNHAHRQAGLRADDRFPADACTSVLQRAPRREPTRLALQWSRPVPQHGIRPADLHGKPVHQGRQVPAHWLPQSGLAPSRSETHRAAGLVHRDCVEVRTAPGHLRTGLKLDGELALGAVGHAGTFGSGGLGILGQGSRENASVPSDGAGAWRPCQHMRDCFFCPAWNRKPRMPAFLPCLSIRADA